MTGTTSLRFDTVENKPYVGITGPITKEEVKSLVDLFNNYGFSMDSGHIPMIGFLVSYKSLKYGYNPGDRRYPKLSELPEILSESKDSAFTTIHYNTKTPSSLYSEVSRVMQTDNIYKRGLVEGLQINVAWPPKEDVKKIRESFPNLEIILQLPKAVLDSEEPDDIADRVVADYSYVEYVLVDPSGGNGKDMNIKMSASVYSSLKRRGFKGVVGLAGGLRGDNVRDTVEKLASLIGNNTFSIDAQGGLRDVFSEDPGDSVLNYEKIASYLQGARSIQD